MEFEHDTRKSASNLLEHGIDFLTAERLWDDERRVEISARVVDEPRWLVIGMMDGKHWSAVTTLRGNRTRLISVRRARLEEIAIYENADI
jgi:uncharacterized DUF497 family protein